MPAEVRWAWRRLVRSAGAVPIGSLAREAGWSHKHLITRFRQQVGLTPRAVARLLRFEDVWHYLRDGEPARWDRIAADGGYAGRSHPDPRLPPVHRRHPRRLARPLHPGRAVRAGK